MTKLKENDVLRIRQEFDRLDCPTQIALGLKYGVSNRTISDIVRRVTWNHLSRWSTPIEDGVLLCPNGEHPSSSKVGQYRWRCKTCGTEWYGPNY